MRADANEAVIINEIINADFFAFSLVLFGAFLGKPKKHHAWWKTILSIAIEHFFLNGALHIFHPHELCLFTPKIRALVFFMQIILDAYYNFPFKAMIFPGQKLYSLETTKQRQHLNLHTHPNVLVLSGSKLNQHSSLNWNSPEIKNIFCYDLKSWWLAITI